MANRDRAQGFGFMYVNIGKILEEKAEIPKNEEAPVLTSNVHTAHFNKDAEKIKVVPTENTKENTKVMLDRTTAISQIKENLDRLQSLHHKLHAMLEELNRITETDKRKKLE